MSPRAGEPDLAEVSELVLIEGDSFPLLPLVVPVTAELCLANSLKFVNHAWVLLCQYVVAGRSADATLNCYLSLACSSYPDLSRWADCFPAPGEHRPKTRRTNSIVFFIRIVSSQSPHSTLAAF